jgi:hypothetical protein
MKISFISLTNDGYMDYTLNCIESLKRINYDIKNLTCYCIGDKCYNRIKDIGCNVENISDENKNMVEYGSKNWGNVLKYKSYIIQLNLNQNDYVCITDGDIVYEKNGFIEDCLEKIQNEKLDMICQSGDKIKEHNKNYNNSICCGFMFIKSNNITKKLFDYKNLIISDNWKEQPYIINRIKKLNIKVKTLDPILYPNGSIYYRFNKEIKSPYLIHFNWVIGDKKKEMMKKYNKWYIN